jgi:hypothetical protein
MPKSPLMYGQSTTAPERLDQKEPPSRREPGPQETGRDRPRVKPEQYPEHKAGPQQQARSLLRRHAYAAFAIATVVAALLVGGVMWWLHARNYESTDDAFVDARNVNVSPQVQTRAAFTFSSSPLGNLCSFLFITLDRSRR